MGKKLNEIIDEMEKLATGLAKLQTIVSLKEVLALFEADKISEARQFAKEIWEDMDYEYYALDRGCGELPKEQGSKIFSLSLLIEEGQHWFIRNLHINSPSSFGGPLMAMMIDKNMPEGKKAYTSLLRKLMEVAK